MTTPVPVEEVELVLSGEATDTQGHIVRAEITVKVEVPQPTANRAVPASK
jgi:hypothetical protein